jgi:hypothetical protein
MRYSHVQWIAICKNALVMTIAVAAFGAHAEDSYFRLGHPNADLAASCGPLQLSQFMNVQQVATISLKGARAHGFDMELNLTRSQVQFLNRALRDGTPDAKVTKTLRSMPRHIQAIFKRAREVWRQRGFSLGQDGQILELLAGIKLEQQFPPEDYIHLSGVSYMGINNVGEMKRSVGELDIVVVRRSDCRVVVIGECKLNSNSVGRARLQLSQFGLYLYQLRETQAAKPYARQRWTAFRPPFEREVESSLQTDGHFSPPPVQCEQELFAEAS